MKTLTISDLLTAYRSGQSTPRALLAAIREREAVDDNPGVWIHRLTDEELEPYLKRLEAASPADLPLYGIPFAIKDNIDLAGVPTTAACPDYAYTPGQSAHVVQKLIDAGAIPLGKTNLDQFATGLVGTRSPYGIPRNPLAPDRVPGGSSSGSAVAVSEGWVAFSLGTDTAGSGRVPAAFNRIWGVKPSCGRLSTRGVVPACRTLDCVSIFANNAADASTVLKIAEGYDANDPFSRPLENNSLPSRQRIGVPRPEQLLFFGDAGYAKAWQASLAALVERGLEIVEVDFAPFLEAARLLYEGPWVAERYTALKDFFAAHADAIHPVTQTIIGGGVNITGTYVYSATYRLAELKRRAQDVFDEITALVTPTAGGFPTLAEVAADPYGPNTQLGYYTNFMNLLDLCAVACPASDSASGLPFGITWIAPAATDHDLLALAAGDTAHVPATPAADTLPLVLFGAHMEGLPLNPSVRAMGASFLEPITTAPRYRMVQLTAVPPARPGVITVPADGVSMAGELWAFPKTAIGELLSTIQAPLGLGIIELSDGRQVHGFLCDAIAAQSNPDISLHGGWRKFCETRIKE